jgi:HEPN domain-containing protein
MNSNAASPAYMALNVFAQEHSSAFKLLHVAAHDYAAARCLLQNLLITGLTLGAQAIEKLLKAHLLLADPKRDVKHLGHALPRLAQEVASLFPKLPLLQHLSMIERFERHYNSRYPDNVNSSTSMTTGDLLELDPLVVLLNETLPCPLNVKMRTGFYYTVTFSLNPLSTSSPTEFWIKNHNYALNPLLPRINKDYFKVMKNLYPDQVWGGENEANSSDVND